MTRAIAALGLLAAIGITASHASAQSRPLVAPEAMAIYRRLLPQIARIKLFDHHAHPAFPDDPDVDIAPPPPGATMLRLRPENPETVAAARALFGFPFADMAGAHGKWLVDRKAALKRQYAGAAYFNYVLDQLGIETSMANRVAMADYLDPARFKWVFFVDCFMFPFDNSALAIESRPRGLHAAADDAAEALRSAARTGVAAAGDVPGISGVRDAHARGEPAPRRRRHQVRSVVLPVAVIRRSRRGSRRADLPEVPRRRRAIGGRVHAVSGFHLPASDHRRVDIEAARAHSHIGRRRRLLQPARRQRAEPRTRRARSEASTDDLRADPWRVSRTIARRCCWHR